MFVYVLSESCRIQLKDKSKCKMTPKRPNNVAAPFCSTRHCHSVIPPLFPVWYGLMRICSAAGLVILVNSWARFGSGSRPFLLLRIWRRNKYTHRKVWGGKIGLCVRECVYVCVCSTVCVLILSLEAPDGCGNHYTSLHHQNMSAVSTEQSRSGRQMNNNKVEKGTELCEERAGGEKGTEKRSIYKKKKQGRSDGKKKQK